MTEKEMLIAENLRRVKENIESARLKSPNGCEVTLLGATKTVAAEDIVFAAGLGLRVAGENRVQEFTEKYDAVRTSLDEYHFIGHLQTNKVKFVVGKSDLIHSVSSLRLASELDRRAASLGVTQDVLMEINCAAEESKSGFLPADAPGIISEFEAFSSLNLRGIMTMGPAGAEKDVLRKYFQETYAIFIDNFTKKSHNIRETVLSMGMSDSYQLAIEEGANLVRVGSAVFGGRIYG